MRWIRTLTQAKVAGIARIPLVASRHDTTSTTCRASRDVTWRAVSCCVVRAARACSNMADVWRLSRSWWRTCHASCARRDVLCRACCTARVTQHVVYYFFLYQNACELDSESWRVVTWRNKWNLGLCSQESHTDTRIRLSWVQEQTNGDKTAQSVSVMEAPSPLGGTVWRKQDSVPQCRYRRIMIYGVMTGIGRGLCPNTDICVCSCHVFGGRSCLQQTLSFGRLRQILLDLDVVIITTQFIRSERGKISTK